MPDLTNAAIADALEELGDLYELDGAIVHRVLAYRNAARAVRESSVSVVALARAGRATELAGIGDTLQQKIVTLLQTGTTPSSERLRAQFPPGLVEIARLPGLGPKRARLLHDELGIHSLQQLREAALAQRLRGVRGLGPKFEANVLSALEESFNRAAPRLLLPAAIELGEALIAGLRENAPADATIELAGSTRRMVDAVKDIDVIATTAEPRELTDLVAELEQIESVASSGAAGARARTHSGVSVDLRVARPEQHGNLLQHFTGSARHNAALREGAVRRGLHVSEYGVREDANARTHTSATEQEVYDLLGLAWIEPELREDRGELQAAILAPAERARGASGKRGSAKGAKPQPPSAHEGLPRLIAERDIRGDLHCHTIASDGRATITEMGRAARERGYEYLAITDHSATHGFGNDVSPAELRAQIERIGEANARLEGIELLAGSEVNILPDGSLDYEDELLARLDWAIASVHTAFAISEQAMTERMIAAIEHPLVDAIGHPTGRLIERRAPYALDLDAVFAAAARTGTMLEINANPNRRDLSDVNARAAARAGVRLLINSDAHRTDTLANMRWGVATARRAWLGAADVANTRPWAQLAPLRKRARSSS
ncbi:MAG TPA: PHP domain-containing protein [Solirubrobacteraceae bacterium]|jgi:DNA polymerase (family 10)